MCTVVVSRAATGPVLLLALRDELTGRPFDDPGTWWPEQPGVVGGRDRQAGGTWCASDPATGTTALVLNRASRPVAAPGAPSRGVLPLLALRHGEDWPAHVALDGMASSALLLAGPGSTVLWEHDGSRLTRTALAEGTHMVTSRGAEDGKAERHLAAFAARPAPDAWQALVTGTEPRDDPTALLVRSEHDGRTYATVFGQVIEAAPGRVRLRCSRTPDSAATWREQVWPRG